MVRIVSLIVLSTWTLCGCATTGSGLPSAGFYGFSVATVQDEPDDESLKLRVGLDFQVKNPLGIALTVPEHTFGFKVNGVSLADAGVQETTQVAPRGKKILTYSFELDLADQRLASTMGKEGTFEFTADADLSLPTKFLDGDLGGAISEAVGVEGPGSAGDGDGMGSWTLKFGHEGRLKLPLLPVMEAPDSTQMPLVRLTGDMEMMDMGEILGPFRDQMGPFAELIEDALSRDGIDRNVEIPIGTMLQSLGVPSELTGGAISALNTFLTLNGKQGISTVSSTTVSVPIRLPGGVSILEGIDPQAAQKAEDFAAGWDAFMGANFGLDGTGVRVPTALPSGMRVAAPFTMRNPNEFSIAAPTFRLGIVSETGQALLVIESVPAGSEGRDIGDPQFRSVQVNGGGSTEMVLVSEVNWDSMAGGLLSLADGDGAPVEEMFLKGELSVDLGYGPVTIPLQLRLPTPVP